MEIFWILFFVFFAGIIVLLILSGIFRATRSTTTNQSVAPSLQGIYDKGTSENNMLVTQGVKSFRVTSSNRFQDIKDGMRFGLSTSFLPSPIGSTEQIGFAFHAIGPVAITAVQFIAQLTPTPFVPRQIGLFDLVTRETLAVITTASTDLITNGFVTHVLDNPIDLIAFRGYAVGGIVTAGDSALDVDNVSYNNELKIEGSAINPNASTIGFPTFFGDVSTIQNFFSFQMQLTQVVNQNIFDVDLTTGGYPRMPPGYVRGLNISTTSDGSNVIIEKGVCLSNYQSANILVPVPLSLSAQQGINGLDTGTFQTDFWYHVYVIGSSTIGMNPAGLMSLNPQAPDLFPINYDTSRRLGAVRWTGSAFDPMQQNGDGPTRETFYTTINHLFSTINGPTDYIPLSLQFVPPTAVHASIQVQGSMFGTPANSNSGPRNGLVRYRTIGSTSEGLWTSSFQDDTRPSTTTDVELVANQLPLAIEIRVFAGPLGIIPNEPNNPNVGQFVTQFIVLSYEETI